MSILKISMALVLATGICMASGRSDRDDVGAPDAHHETVEQSLAIGVPVYGWYIDPWGRRLWGVIGWNVPIYDCYGNIIGWRYVPRV